MTATWYPPYPGADEVDQAFLRNFVKPKGDKVPPGQSRGGQGQGQSRQQVAATRQARAQQSETRTLQQVDEEEPLPPPRLASLPAAASTAAGGKPPPKPRVAAKDSRTPPPREATHAERKVRSLSTVGDWDSKDAVPLGRGGANERRPTKIDSNLRPTMVHCGTLTVTTHFAEQSNCLNRPSYRPADVSVPESVVLSRPGPLATHSISGLPRAPLVWQMDDVMPPWVVVGASVGVIGGSSAALLSDE